MQTDTKDSEQSLENRSYDPTFEVETRELLGHDGTNLQRLTVDANGIVKVILV